MIVDNEVGESWFFPQWERDFRLTEKPSLSMMTKIAKQDQPRTLQDTKLTPTRLATRGSSS